MIRRLALLPAVGVAVAACSVLGGGAAQAATVPPAADAADSADSATAPPAAGDLAQPFLQWGDANVYAAVPGGSFERGGPGWSLGGSAHVGRGNEPFRVAGSGRFSLALGPGASATSPAFTVSASTPTLRFFTAGFGSGSLQVSVNVPEDGQSVSIPVATVATSAWSPTQAITLPTQAFGAGASVTVTLTATGNASFRADDVYVDPAGLCC